MIFIHQKAKSFRIINQIKSFVVLAVFCVFAAGDNTAPLEEISQLWQAAGKTVSNYSARNLNLSPSYPEAD